MDADTMLAGIRRWVEIESHTPDHEGMAAMVALVEGSYAGAGARIERIPGRDGYGDHLVARSPWGEGPGVLILSHLDTVHPVARCCASPTGSRATSPTAPASST